VTASLPLAERDELMDLDGIAEALHLSFQDARFEVRTSGAEAMIRLSWELFDDPTEPGKILVVRFLDPAAPEGRRLAGKLTAALRPQPDGGVWLDCTGPFHGVSLRPDYQRQGLVGRLLRELVLPRLPPPAGVLAAVGRGTGAGFALEFFRAYMEQRRGAEWLASEAGRHWWSELPESRHLDWETAGGYPSVFALLKAVGLRLRLEEEGRLRASLPVGGGPED
jgi:hypothetical protein